MGKRIIIDQIERKTLGTTLVVIAVLLIAALILGKGDDVLLINGSHHPVADNFFRTVTYIGDGIIFLPLVILLLFVRFGLSIASLAAWASHGVICSILKRLVFPDMARPAAILSHDMLHFVSGVSVHQHHTFPSGHTATAFCFAVLISLITRKQAILVVSMLLAVLTAYSRVYLLQHFVIDVAVGAFIGSLTAFTFWFLFKQWTSNGWMSNRLEIQVRARVSPR